MLVRRIILLLIALNVAAFIVFEVTRHRSEHPMTAQERAVEVVAAANEEQGVMTAPDTRHLETIASQEEQTGILTDDDVDWLILRMNNPLDSSKPDAAAQAHVSALAIFMDAKHLTPAQKAKILAASVPLLTRPDPNIEGHSSDRIWSSAIIARLGDRSYGPKLIPLLRDPDPLVRAAAIKALSAIGYSVSP
jgi:hypothetical protein